MKTSFMLLPLIVRKESREEIWPLRGFFVVSLILVDPGVVNKSSFAKAPPSTGKWDPFHTDPG